MDFSKVLKKLEKSPLIVCHRVSLHRLNTLGLPDFQEVRQTVPELDFFIKFVVNCSVLSVDNRVY